MAKNYTFVPEIYSDDEDYDEYDDEDYYPSNKSSDKQLNNSKNVFLNYNSAEEPTNWLNDSSDSVSPIVLQNSSKLSPKPKRQTVMRSSSPSSGSLVLDDIRLGVINGNLVYLKSQIESQNNFFIDSILKAGWTALMFGCKGGHQDIVHYCLECGADPNYHKDNFTPLMAVCSSINPNEDDLTACVGFLIEFGVNVNSCDNYGNSSLIIASKSGKYSIVCQLIENNAELNHPSNDGWTALHWAAREGYGKIIEKLINSGIDISLKTSSEQTAADIALSKEHQKIFEILENVKQRVNENVNEEQNNGSGNRRLSEDEIQSLVTYVKPNNLLEMHEKIKNKKKKDILHDDFEQLEDFLRISDLSDLLEKFEDNCITYKELVENPEQVVEKIGLKEAHVIKKIVYNVNLVHKQKWSPQSLRELTLDTKITCPDVHQIITNISEQQCRITECIEFLLNKVNKNPELMNYDTDLSSISKVRTEVSETVKNTRFLYNRLICFHQRLGSITDTSEPPMTKVSHIPFEDLNNNITKSGHSKCIIISALTVGLLTVVAFKSGNIFKENLIGLIVGYIPRPKFPKFNYILLTI